MPFDVEEGNFEGVCSGEFIQVWRYGRRRLEELWMVPIMEEYLSWIKPKGQTRRLLEKVRDIWSDYLKHPFVRGIGDGSLDKEKFRFYLKQDYLYLVEYAKVFAIGIAKADDEEVMRFFSDAVHAIFTSEMNIHRAYMQRFGVTAKEIADTMPSLANRSYTSYMLRVAYEGSIAEILASVLSCALSYEYIAKAIVSEYPQASLHPFYGEWVSGYAGEDYQRNNQRLVEFFEIATKDFSEKQLLRCEDIFVTCSLYEATFWEMAWRMKIWC